MVQQSLAVWARSQRGITGFLPQGEKAARLPTDAHRTRNSFLMMPPPIVPGIDAGADRTPSVAFFSLSLDVFVLKYLSSREEIG